jgi:hypothetical protein
MAAAVLSFAIALVCGGGLWLALGPRLALSSQTDQNELLNLVAYVGMILPLAFLVVFFGLEGL